MGGKRARNCIEEELYYPIPYFAAYANVIIESLNQVTDRDRYESLEQVAPIFDELLAQLEEDIRIENEVEVPENDCLEDTFPRMPFPEFPPFPQANPIRDRQVGMEAAWNHLYRKTLVSLNISIFVFPSLSVEISKYHYMDRSLPRKYSCFCVLPEYGFSGLH